jgi:outer membrane protein assembly factor BamD
MRNIIFISLLILIFPAPAKAFWVWTPETNKWENPKYVVKATPQDQLKYAMEFYLAGDFPSAIREFTKLIKHYPRAREAAEAQFQIGETQYAMGELMKAYKSYQVVIDKYPFSERAPDIVNKQFDIGNDILNGKNSKNKFMQIVSGSDYDPIEVFRAVIKNAPYGPQAAHAQYKIGLYLMGKGLYQEARDEFEKTMNDYPASEWARAAKYQIALADAQRSSSAAYDQKVTEVAIQEFKDFVKEHPDAELSQDAKGQIQNLREKEAESQYVIAAFYEKQKKWDAAKVYYNSVISDYKDTSWAKKSAEQLQALVNK